MGHLVCTYTYVRNGTHGALCPNGVSRSLHAARAIPPYSSLLSPVLLLAFRYCILVPPVYIRSLPQALAAHLLLLPQTAGSPHWLREKTRERDKDWEGGRYHYILRDTLNGPRSTLPRAVPSRGILARESSILHEGIGSSLPIAHPCRGCTKLYDFAYMGQCTNFLFFYLISRNRTLAFMWRRSFRIRLWKKDIKEKDTREEV